MPDLDGFRLGLFSAIVAGVVWAVYWPQIKALTVPLHPTLHQGAMIAAAILGVLALASSPGLAGGLLAGVGLVGAGFFMFSSLMSRMPSKKPAVSVGEPFLEFTSRDHDGLDFSIASLKGRPFLLKFYRGHW